MSRLLDNALLAQLDARLRALRSSTYELLQPGLTESEIQALVRPLGIELPTEAKLWWTWRNGVRFVEGPAGLRFIGPHYVAISLEEAVQRYESAMKVAEQAATETFPSEYWWESSWFPLIGLSSGSVVCDCNATPDGQTPVRFISPSRFDAADFREIRFVSVGDLISAWIDEIDSGRWVVEDGLWREL